MIVSPVVRVWGHLPLSSPAALRWVVLHMISLPLEALSIIGLSSEKQQGEVGKVTLLPVIVLVRSGFYVILI